MNQEDQKLDHKQTLKHLAKRLKQVLNPRITDADYTGKVGIKLVTDIPLTYSDIISFSVKCLSDNNGSKSIYTIGYFYSGENLCATNLGSDRILQIGIYNDLENVNIILVPSEYSTILETESEVFITDEDQNGNKNHVISIEYLDESELEELELYLQTVDTGELDYHFSYIIKTGESSEQEITEGHVESTPIDTIWKSEQSSKLDHTVNITVNGGDSHEEGVLIYGEGELDTTENTSNDLELTVDVEAITQAVSESISEDISQIIPDASTSERGVIALATTGQLNTNQLPVQVLYPEDDLDHLPRAYVDVKKIYDRINQDVHRYIRMEDASEEHTLLGEIVQYIGNTTSQYIHGYFYIRTKEIIAGSLRRPTKWTDVDPQTTAETLQSALTEYNRQNDHCLVVSESTPIYITPNLSEVGTIISSTEFIISNAVYSSTLTYADILQWGIQISPQYLTVTDLENLPVAIIDLRYPTLDDVWVQKNVLPAINMQSALVYKGTCTWAELQSYTSTALPGDFWTVSDKANQEYFFNGTSWEFMGDIFDPYEAGDGIAITSTHDISVKYDNSTIKKNGSGNLYVNGVLTDTQADWNETDTSSAAYINHKPIIPTVNDATVVFSILGNDSDKFAHFTLNQDSDTEITIKEGANIKLYPDLSSNQLAIEAVDTTYGDFAGSSHGLVPSASSGDSTKFLKGDGTWATPSGTGLTGVSFNGTDATVTSGVAAITASVGDTNVIETVKVNGSALTPDANKAVDITIPQGTVTSVSAGVGLTTSDGNAITSSGTVKAKLDSETSLGTIGSTSQLYAIGVDSDGKLAVNVPWVNDNTTYSFTQSGNTLTVTPSTGTASTYTPTFTDTDEKLKISTSNAKTYLTGITTAPDSTEVAYKGVANTGVYATNGDLHLDGNISHNCESYIKTSTGSIDITYMSKKYINVDCNYEGRLDIYLNQDGSFDGVKEVVCRINNIDLSHGYLLNVRVNYLNPSTDGVTKLKNFYNSSLISSTGLGLDDGESMELVFTFWGVNDVTFNGGISV